MSKVDFSKKPEGATHYSTYPDGRLLDWFKVNPCGTWLCWWDTFWKITEERDGIMGNLYRILEIPVFFDLKEDVPCNSGVWVGDGVTMGPTQNNWSGPQDGLPPVGLDVWFSHDGTPQGTGRVLFYGSEFCIIENTTGGAPYEQTGLIESYSFSATSHEEQRETAIREFMDVVGIDCRVTAGKAVDAGFKRGVV